MILFVSRTTIGRITEVTASVSEDADTGVRTAILTGRDGLPCGNRTTRSEIA